MRPFRTTRGVSSQPPLCCNLILVRRLERTLQHFDAISQLTMMTVQSAACLCLRWPYHAKVMNTLEIVRRMAVFMEGMYKGVIGIEGRSHEWTRRKC